MTCNPRVDEWLREFNQYVAGNDLPTVEFVRLGNDHTEGNRRGLVTAVARPRHEKELLALGASTVVADPAAAEDLYDLVADWVGGPSLAAGLGKVAPRGTVVLGSSNAEKHRSTSTTSSATRVRGWSATCPTPIRNPPAPTSPPWPASSPPADSTRPSA
jgi:hypothetical protein